MTAIRVTVALGIAILGFVCWLAVKGFGPATELLVTLVALFLMIVGGSYLSGRMGVYGRGRRPAGPPRPISTAGAERHCPGADLAGHVRPGAEVAGRTREPRPAAGTADRSGTGSGTGTGTS